MRARMAVVIITAHCGSIDNAVEAMRRGAFDYLAKPFTPGAGPGGVGARGAVPEPPEPRG